MFDSLVWDALKRFDPEKPVFVEAESKKIGQVQAPAALLERMREGECLRLEVAVAERVRFLIDEYRHFLDDPSTLRQKLRGLTARHGHAVIERWIASIEAGAWEELVGDLLVTHYDPSYLHATTRNYPRQDEAQAVRIERLDDSKMQRAADDLLRNGA
jgi:tRNA 2-selenouridine synthase